MTLAAGSISDLPVSAQVVATTTKKPPRNRQLVAKPDDVAAPEAR
jgi:hypothetical protein